MDIGEALDVMTEAIIAFAVSSIIGRLEIFTLHYQLQEKMKPSREAFEAAAEEYFKQAIESLRPSPIRDAIEAEREALWQWIEKMQGKAWN